MSGFLYRVNNSDLMLLGDRWYTTRKEAEAVKRKLEKHTGHRYKIQRKDRYEVEKRR